MIKGPVKHNHSELAVDEIFTNTNGGYDIYRLYLGKVSREMQRPWGKKEKKPSWGIYIGENNIWYWKDLANEESGNAIQFVERFLGLSFRGAIDRIVNDFGIENGKRKLVTKWQVPTREEYSHIAFTEQPFKQEHHEFWNCVGVNEEDCKVSNCYAVKSLALNRKIINIRKNEPVFAYYAPEIKGVKIYFPNRTTGRFLTNVPYQHLWNIGNIQPCNNLIIQKSNKDMIVTKMLNSNIICTQAEAIKIFTEEVIQTINNICPTPTLWYGADEDGQRKAGGIVKITGWNSVATPVEMLDEINDVYSFTKKHGLKELEQFMKQRNLI